MASETAQAKMEAKWNTQIETPTGKDFGIMPVNTTEMPTGKTPILLPKTPEISGSAGTTPATAPEVLNVQTTAGGGSDAGIKTTDTTGKKMLPDTAEGAATAAAQMEGGSGGSISFQPVINLASKEIDTPFGKYALWVLAVIAFIAWRLVKKVL